MRQVNKPVEVAVVLVMAAVPADPLGSLAWRAIQEAASLYHVGDGWIDVRLAGANDLLVAPRITVHYLGRAPVKDMESAVPAHQVEALLARSVWVGPSESPRSPVTSNSSSAPSGSPVMDQRALVAFARDLLGISSGTLVVVHDRPIQPPPQWRYLIWDYVPGGVAVSFATLDPRYWGDRVDEAERWATLGSRLRAALCSVLGSAIGLLRCDNPSCFLYATVDRVSRLDRMVRIGEEHHVPVLTGRGFAPAAGEPDAVAEIIQIDEAVEA